MHLKFFHVILKALDLANFSREYSNNYLSLLIQMGYLLSTEWRFEAAYLSHGFAPTVALNHPPISTLFSLFRLAFFVMKRRLVMPLATPLILNAYSYQ